MMVSGPLVPGRPRKGAWIEIFPQQQAEPDGSRRPRKGAWIEILGDKAGADCGGGRPRKGAWIEITLR